MGIQPTKCGKVLKNSTRISNSLGGECNWEEGARYELKSQQFRQHLRRSFALDQSTSAFRDYRIYDQTQSLEFVIDVEVRQAEEYLDLFFRFSKWVFVLFESIPWFTLTWDLSHQSLRLTSWAPWGFTTKHFYQTCVSVTSEAVINFGIWPSSANLTISQSVASNFDICCSY